ncbi:MAG: DNA polymerase III subunit delta' [Hyphomicrobiales bacterium]
MSATEHELPIADRIEGLKQPYEHSVLKGQEEAEARFLEAACSGRLHHAWLLSGPSGCGKATFAFRMARYFAQANEEGGSPTVDDLNKAGAHDNPTFKQIARGAHPNILHLRIPFDEKTKKFRTLVTVDEVRRSVAFFGMSSGGKGWRIAIVDSANDMNANAANALLKILEEPPERTVFFLLSSQPGRLLPTIRSRCQHLALKPLDNDNLIAALENASYDITFEADTLKRNHTVINGSVRRAFHFANNDAEALLNDFNTLIGQQPTYDIPMLHRFADSVSARSADEKYAFFIEFIENYVANKVRVFDNIRPLVSWTEVWDKMQARIKQEEALNLDRKQTVLALFHDLRI